jgi:F0F1-type ATP synthase epsilon subunit
MLKSEKSDRILLTVRQRTSLIFQGEVKAFSSCNSKGDFDIMPQHINFITIISKLYKIHNLDGSITEMNIDDGIVRVHMNKVNVYLGVG